MNILDKIKTGSATLGDQDEALKQPNIACWFAHNVSGADIEKCQEVACIDPHYASWFAHYVQGADITKCQEAACKNPLYAYIFARDIPGADIEKCIKSCKGTKYENMLNEALMEQALL